MKSISKVAEVYRIYVDGDDTNREYDAESASDAISQYISECRDEYYDAWGEYPDDDEFIRQDISAEKEDY